MLVVIFRESMHKVTVGQGDSEREHRTISMKVVHKTCEQNGTLGTCLYLYIKKCHRQENSIKRTI